MELYETCFKYVTDDYSWGFASQDGLGSVTCAAVLHITVSHFVSRGDTMTAICKRSFSMCNSLFSGVPLVLYVNVLRGRFWNGDNLAVRGHEIYTFRLSPGY